MRKTLIIAAALMLTACASVGEEGGWTGQGAQPFDSARTECEAETLSNHGPTFDACMSTKGWTRTP